MDEITELLQEKLRFLEKAWVLEADPTHKFKLKKDIEEVKAELAARGGQTAGNANSGGGVQFGNISVQSVTGNVIIQQAGNDVVINRK